MDMVGVRPIAGNGMVECALAAVVIVAVECNGAAVAADAEAAASSDLLTCG